MTHKEVKVTENFITKRPLAISIIMLCGLILVAACAPTQPTTNPPPTEAAATEKPTAESTAAETTAPQLEGDMVRGGRLYDAWWEVEAEAEQEEGEMEHETAG